MALKALEHSAALAPPSYEDVREAIGRLRPGQPADVAIRHLRRATWPAGEAMPPLRRTLGAYGGQFIGPPKSSHLRLTFPAALLGTPVELAVAIHEHQHARVERALPQLRIHEMEIAGRVIGDAEAFDAMDLGYERAELSYWNERIAMAGESAIYRALTDNERNELIRRIERLTAEELDPERAISLLAGLRAGPSTVEGYLYSQFRTGRYDLKSIQEGWVKMVEIGQTLRQMRRWFDEKFKKSRPSDEEDVP